MQRMTSNLKWKKIESYIWKSVKTQERMGSEIIPRWQYFSGEYSILSPSLTTMDCFELFDGEEIYRFDTLKEAKDHAQLLNNKNE